MEHIDVAKAFSEGRKEGQKHDQGTEEGAHGGGHAFARLLRGSVLAIADPRNLPSKHTIGCG